MGAKYSHSDISLGDGGGGMNGFGNRSNDWSFISKSSDGINLSLLLLTLRLCRFFSRATSGGR